MANPNISIKYTKIFINNEFVDALSGKTFETLNPANEKKIADVAEGDQADIDEAVKAACKAFESKSAWRTMDASERGKLIFKLADLIERDVIYLANLESLDNGKPYTESLLDIEAAVGVLRYYGGWCDKIHGNTIPVDGNYMSMTRKEPVGVVGQILPWNYPIMMVAWKWGPVIATGCVSILKPAEQTPLTALYLAALTKEAGFPPGVLNVVPGYGPTAGAAIALHPKIRKVAFTGSTEVGKIILAAASQSNLKKVSLELGGKSPLVIMDDADVDEAVLIAHNAIFGNHGQNCCAGSRTFVHENIYDVFIKKSIELAAKRVVGDPFNPSVQQGPQVNQEMLNKILNLINSGITEGAKLEFGGKRIGTLGYFVEPTIFSNVQDEMRISKEEIFGPVQSILKFSDFDELLHRANNTNYGLASGIITKNINTAMKFAQNIEAGSVWINCYDAVLSQAPFGGYKESGIGRELGQDGLEAYLETKAITIRTLSK